MIKDRSLPEIDNSQPTDNLQSTDNSQSGLDPKQSKEAGMEESIIWAIIISLAVIAGLVIISLILIGCVIYAVKNRNNKVQDKVNYEQNIIRGNNKHGNGPGLSRTNSRMMRLNRTKLFSSEAAKNKRLRNSRPLTPNRLVKSLRESLIGHHGGFTGPFGKRPVTYCDYIASGRGVTFIEDFISRKVLPFYANTHTTTTVTALQTTLFRDEARRIISDAVHANQNEHAVIFAGSGSTGAIHKLLGALKPSFENKKVIVFNGIMEHHSNILPWRELPGVEIITIPEDRYGRIDKGFLRQTLEDHSHSREQNVMIGCFTTASNITGVMSDDVGITQLLQEYHALSFWDYAGSGPYVNIDIKDKDAIYFSMHKFVGGVQTPGVLVAKRNLFNNDIPVGVGGGTVVYVTQEKQCYVKDIETREEGGTPAIVESIRAGLAMRLKMSIGTDYIMRKEDLLMSKARAKLKQIPNAKLMGNPYLPRLPILSLLIMHPETSLYLHHNFVCALLNDIFGIQARGGCACAGPYTESLLDMDSGLVEQYIEVLTDDKLPMEIMKPGFARLNLTWFAEDEEIDFVLEALSMIADLGWMLLPQYKFNAKTSKWTHIKDDPNGFPEVHQLAEAPLERSEQSRSPKNIMSYREILHEAENIFSKAKNVAKRISISDERQMFKGNISDLRWFLLPFEAKKLLCTNEDISDGLPPEPFQVRVYDRINTDSVEIGTLHGSGRKRTAKSWHSALNLNEYDDDDEVVSRHNNDDYEDDDDDDLYYSDHDDDEQERKAFQPGCDVVVDS